MAAIGGEHHMLACRARGLTGQTTLGEPGRAVVFRIRHGVDKAGMPLPGRLGKYVANFAIGPHHFVLTLALIVWARYRVNQQTAAAAAQNPRWCQYRNLPLAFHLQRLR